MRYWSVLQITMRWRRELGLRILQILVVCMLTWIWDLNQDWIRCCEVFFQVTNAIKLKYPSLSNNIRVLICKRDSRRFMNLMSWVRCIPISRSLFQECKFINVNCSKYQELFKTFLKIQLHSSFMRFKFKDKFRHKF